jgi:glycosyltransferase involved in cell wall biosynthesis
MFGLFDRRIDTAVLAAAARTLPAATFAVVGPLVDRSPEEFRDLPNLRFFDAVPYSELPGHVAHFDVCILPYVLDATTHSINPLKLKEYLATGKPVVATPLPEAVKLGWCPS